MMELAPDIWILAVRAAGVAHLVTLVLAWFTPIPPDWEANLARLPEVHRRFAVAQNFFIGAVLAFLGLVSLLAAPLLVDGSPLARVLCGATALWWGGRLVVLPWLGARRHLDTPLLRVGYRLLLIECAVMTAGYGYLALR
jgi:hypothetical protein